MVVHGQFSLYSMAFAPGPLDCDSSSMPQVEALYMLTGALDNPLGDGGCLVCCFWIIELTLNDIQQHLNVGRYVHKSIYIYTKLKDSHSPVWVSVSSRRRRLQMFMRKESWISTALVPELGLMTTYYIPCQEAKLKRPKAWNTSGA